MSGIPEEIMEAAKMAYLTYPKKGEDEWLPIARTIAAERQQMTERMARLEVQNDWLKDRLADLHLARDSRVNIEEWLSGCGMPPVGVE